MPVAGKGKMIEEMETDIDPDDHLICGCRPQLSLCGRYDPNANGAIQYVEITDQWCKDCVKVWKSHGCGSCGCSYHSVCNTCWPRIYLHQAATDRS